MTSQHGRTQPTPSQPYPGNDKTFAGVYSWNKPNASINPLLDIERFPKASPLARVIDAYRQDLQAATDALLTEGERKARGKRQRWIEYFEEAEDRKELFLARLVESKKLNAATPL